MNVVGTDGEPLVLQFHVDGILIEARPGLRQAIILAFQDFVSVIFHRRQARAVLTPLLKNPQRIPLYNNFDKDGTSKLEMETEECIFFNVANLNGQIYSRTGPP